MEILDEIPVSLNERRKSFIVEPTQQTLESFTFHLSQQFIETLEQRDKPTGLAYRLLQLTVEKTPVLNAIIQTRMTQVGSFWKPAKYSKMKRGFQVRLRDLKRHPTPAEQKLIDYVERFIENCGDIAILEKCYGKQVWKDRFHTFLKKITYSRLVYDQINFEIVFNRKGKPVEFFAVDPSTIRLKIYDDGTYKLFQIVNGMVVAEYSPDEMAWVIANPRPDLKVKGYGYPEVERMVRIITAILFAEEYTLRFFQSGATPFGYMVLTGADLHQNLIEKFRRMWATQLTGILGAWRIPVIGLPEGVDIKFEPLAKPTDMPFSEWMTFLVNIACALYQISPDLINFPSRQTREVSSETVVERKFLYHPDRGLYGLLDVLTEAINRYIVWKFSEDLEFDFVGIERLDIRDETELRIRELESYKTLNEIRAELDMPPIPYGDIPLNGTYLTHYERQKELELAKVQLPLQTSEIRKILDEKPDYKINKGGK